MTVFYITEKQQKLRFCLQFFFFIEIIVANPKVNIHSQHTQNSVLVLA